MKAWIPIHVATPPVMMAAKNEFVVRMSRSIPQIIRHRHVITVRDPKRPNSSPIIAKIKSVCAAWR